MNERLVIVYRSKTGFTQRYAEQLAGQLGCAAWAERAIAHSFDRSDPAFLRPLADLLRDA